MWRGKWYTIHRAIPLALGISLSRRLFSQLFSSPDSCFLCPFIPLGSQTQPLHAPPPQSPPPPGPRHPAGASPSGRARQLTLPLQPWPFYSHEEAPKSGMEALPPPCPPRGQQALPGLDAMGVRSPAGKAIACRLCPRCSAHFAPVGSVGGGFLPALLSGAGRNRLLALGFLCGGHSSGGRKPVAAGLAGLTPHD